MELGDLDRGPDNGDLDTHTDRMIGLTFHQGMYFLDTFLSLLGFQGDHQSLRLFRKAVVEILGFKLELARILIRLIILGTVDLHFLLLFLLDGINGGTIVPGVHLLILKLALLTFIPDGSIGLVDTDDVHVVVQRGTLFSKHLLIGTVEDPACLTGIRSILSLDGTEYRQE